MEVRSGTFCNFCVINADKKNSPSQNPLAGPIRRVVRPAAHSTTTWKPETNSRRHFSPWGPLAFLLFHSPDATYPFLHLGISESRRPNVGPGPAKLFGGARPASFFWICVACLTWTRVWWILTSSKCHRPRVRVTLLLLGNLIEIVVGSEK